MTGPAELTPSELWTEHVLHTYDTAGLKNYRAAFPQQDQDADDGMYDDSSLPADHEYPDGIDEWAAH